MSKVAAKFWNHKRIAQSEARQRLKALGILTGDEVEKPVITPPKGLIDAMFKPSPLLEALKKHAQRAK